MMAMKTVTKMAKKKVVRKQEMENLMIQSEWNYMLKKVISPQTNQHNAMYKQNEKDSLFSFIFTHQKYSEFSGPQLPLPYHLQTWVETLLMQHSSGPFAVKKHRRLGTIR